MPGKLIAGGGEAAGFMFFLQFCFFMINALTAPIRPLLRMVASEPEPEGGAGGDAEPPPPPSQVAPAGGAKAADDPQTPGGIV